jgi:hypothetical protein
MRVIDHALTVVLSALLLPFAFKQTHSMQKLQQVAPQMKAIQQDCRTAPRAEVPTRPSPRLSRQNPRGGAGRANRHQRVSPPGRSARPRDRRRRRPAISREQERVSLRLASLGALLRGHMREDCDVIGRPELPWISPPAGGDPSFACPLSRRPTRSSALSRMEGRCHRQLPGRCGDPQISTAGLCSVRGGCSTRASHQSRPRTLTRPAASARPICARWGRAWRVRGGRCPSGS